MRNLGRNLVAQPHSAAWQEKFQDDCNEATTTQEASAACLFCPELYCAWCPQQWCVGKLFSPPFKVWCGLSRTSKVRLLGLCTYVQSP